MLRSYLDRMPLVAILRGVKPDEVVPIGAALVEAGFAIIEVPLNSPDPIASIRLLAETFGANTLIGAGTVTDPARVAEIASAGGKLIVMPHSDPAVVRAAKAAGMVCTPGVATPTEAYAALQNGADALKMFPAEAMPPSVLKAWLSILPKGTALLPVGGISPDTMASYVAVGAAGFGLGSALYKPGFSVVDVGIRARAFVEAWRHAV